MKILCTVGPKGLHLAEIEGAPDMYAGGRSKAEAIGNLVLEVGHIYLPDIEIVEKKPTPDVDEVAPPR